ncbi:hypothetical protein KTO58_17845 [Chitinophaga pendula]|uniref:Kelch repeat-containing protein n=1 Tax=Chitinophaga TaxID=79328 RepID=UPI0012FD7C78|nr:MULTISPECIES: kelch repeat-containing protein [Chitinophaga]UCJ05550.1 hypothetical protein KTO58_17845 [Chitinophaga pendula]
MRNFKGLSLAILLLSAACSKDKNSADKIGNWVKRSDLKGVARGEAVSFVIDGLAYMGSGYDGKKRLQDCWSYNPDTDDWKQVADIPGAARSNAVGMAIGSKGYVGTGYDGVNYLKDFYEFDPVAQTWTKIADFGGSARYDAVAFSAKNKGYVATGYDGNYLKDNWQYDPAIKQWKEMKGVQGTKRKDASVFVINDIAYLVAGSNNGSANVNEFYSYNGDTDTWTRLREISNVSSDSYDDNYNNIMSANASAFTIDGKGYLVNAAATWEYNPQNDLWTEKTALEGSARISAIGFTVKNRGFFGTGLSGSLPFDDLREFQPNATRNDKDN